MIATFNAARIGLRRTAAGAHHHIHLRQVCQHHPAARQQVQVRLDRGMRRPVGNRGGPSRRHLGRIRCAEGTNREGTCDSRFLDPKDISAPPNIVSYVRERRTSSGCTADANVHVYASH